MYFESFADFLAMGRHGLFVWLSYGFFVLILFWNLLIPQLGAQRALKKARDYWMRQKTNSTSEAEHETH